MTPAPAAAERDVEPRRSRPAERAGRALACALCVLCVFRVQVAGGFARLNGDWLDGRIQVSIAEHWFNVLRGVEPWNATAYFYPVPDTLGYNDGYLLNGLLHALFRLGGADPFLAFELANVTIRAIGFLAMAQFAAEALEFEASWATLAAALFTLSNSLYLQGGHSQLLTVAFAPLLAWLAWRTWRGLAVGRRGGAAAWACAAAALFGAWLLTAFYMAFFMTLFTVLTAAAAVLSGFGRRGTAVPALGGAGWPLLAAVAAVALATLPFLLVYLPKARETGMHAFAEVRPYVPVPLDAIHLGSGNWLFGRLDRALTDRLRPGAPDLGELTVGVPPVLLCCALGGTIAAWRNRRSCGLLWCMAAATALSFALSLRFGHTMLWRMVFYGFPGGASVRVVSRYLLFLTGPAVLLAVAFVRRRAPAWPAWLTTICVAVLLAENLTADNGIHLDRRAELAVLAAVPPPPSGCTAFFVERALPRPGTGSAVIDALYPHNVDAMIIAETRGLPTVNGFSTFNPPGWDFASPGRPDYRARIGRYLRRTGLGPGVCGLDLSVPRWTPPPFSDPG